MMRLILLSLSIAVSTNGLLLDLMKNETVTRYRRQTGSSRLNDPCSQNTDCTSFLLYCVSGRCACTSSTVEFNNACLQKIYPGQSGCSQTVQCTATWPRSTCSSGTCVCPTTSSGGSSVVFFPAATRDGYVCVAPQSGTADGNCPLPEYISGTSPNQVIINTYTSLYTAATTQATCTAPGGCTSSTANNNVQDIYDCIQTSSTTTTGRCCPSRAVTCMQAPQTGGTGTAVTRYYYNSVSQTCTQFSFNTAGASAINTNGNNFETLEHCRSYCDNACQRGTQQFSGGSTDAGVTCSASSDNCGTNYGCTRVGSVYLCCGDVDYICGASGGRASGSTSPDVGFSPSVLLAATQTRYYFNVAAGTCTAFAYNGAGGNFNNFANQNDCNTYCEKELCATGVPLKTSQGLNQRCSSSSDCPTQYDCTSGTSGLSQSICCPKAQQICEGARIIGTCSNYQTRYWFNAATGTCESFQYSGCGGNSNNFATQTLCATTCRDTTTAMTCIQGLPYRSSTGAYTVCTAGSGNGNNFFTGTRCPSNYNCYYDGYRWGCCPTKVYTCSLSSDGGRTCTVASTRWYFDTTQNRCLSFTYYGCDGNSNNFATRSQCQTYCGVGGCESGGAVYLESSTSIARTCNAAVTCPSGYQCEPINEGSSVTPRCCPTRAQVCSSSPVTGNCFTTGGQTTAQRYYFNRATRACATFDYRGCENTGNSFATLAQCINYCSSAGCAGGEVIYRNPSSNTPQTCSTSITNGGCPSGYTCRYDSVTQSSYCCGSATGGVCATTEKAYMSSITQEPTTCLPGRQLACPEPFACKFNQRDGKYYCCAPLSGSFCPVGRAAYSNPQTNLPQICTISIFSGNACPAGFTCQTAVVGSPSGFCCSANTACPNGAEIEINLVTRSPIQCTVGSIQTCGNGYSCSSSVQGSTAGFCCRGQFGAVNGGCPPGQFRVSATTGQPNGCNAFSTNTGCPVGATCQWAPTNSVYQCCSTQAPIVNPVQNSNGCPATQVAFLETTGQPRICQVGTNTCPSGYFCQYSTQTQRFQCCGVNGGCPGNQVAQIDNTGGAASCFASTPGSCRAGFACVNGLNGRSVCCSSGQSTINCQPTQVSYNGACIPRVPAGQPCVVTEQCTGNSLCIGQLCTCPAGQTSNNGICQAGQTCSANQVQVFGQCLNRVLPDQPCQATQQCQGGSSCQGNVCRCPVGQTNNGGVCGNRVTQAPVTNVCTGNQVAYLVNGSPQSCSGNSFACPAAYSCTYSFAQRAYFCCGQGNVNPNPNPGGVCSRAQQLIYPQTGQPVTCNLSPSNCPAGYTCTQGPTQTVCCQGGQG